MQNVYIAAIARTPIGAFGGSLSSASAVELGQTVVKKLIERAEISAGEVDELFFGHVLQANAGQAPAKQVALHAGLPAKTPCTTINKVCASGLKAVMLGAQSIMLGQNDVVVAGGMESMSNAPFYIPKGRTGYRFGNAELVDAIVRDGLQDPYDRSMMGMAAEHCAENCAFSRQDQDEFAIESYKRAQTAQEKGLFADEIVAVTIPQRKGEPIVVDKDDEPGRARFDKIPTLRTAFKKEGTVTAANASKINDGAAGVILISESKLNELKCKPLAKIRSFADASQDPVWFTTSPAKAMPIAIKRAGITLSDIDFFEINEAFSVVALANNKIMQIDSAKVNVFGGAVSLGHPIGCSGARILVTLVNVLRKKQGTLGCAGICNGGGGASAMVIEKV